jgi:hypothetical protein
MTVKWEGTYEGCDCKKSKFYGSKVIRGACTKNMTNDDCKPVPRNYEVLMEKIGKDKICIKRDKNLNYY